jgi:hypothetical protein
MTCRLSPIEGKTKPELRTCGPEKPDHQADEDRKDPFWVNTIQQPLNIQGCVPQKSGIEAAAAARGVEQKRSGGGNRNSLSRAWLRDQDLNLD